MMRGLQWRLCGLILLAACTLAAQPDQPLTNADIVRMVQAGVAEQTIITMVQSRPAAFDTGAAALIALKKEGVGDAIIRAMLTAGRPKGEPNIPRASRTLDPDRGISAVRIKGVQQSPPIELQADSVQWRARAANLLVVPLFPQSHVNGVIPGSRSPVRLASPLELVIRCAPGFSAAEYQLVRLKKKSDRREFRTVLENPAADVEGPDPRLTLLPDPTLVPFEVEETAPGTFRVSLPALRKGEYGFLPPGSAAAASAASLGKIYTFGVD